MEEVIEIILKAFFHETWNEELLTFHHTNFRILNLSFTLVKGIRTSNKLDNVTNSTNSLGKGLDPHTQSIVHWTILTHSIIQGTPIICSHAQLGIQL